MKVKFSNHRVNKYNNLRVKKNNIINFIEGIENDQSKKGQTLMIQAKETTYKSRWKSKIIPKKFGKNENSSQPLKNMEIRKNAEEWHV